MQRAAILPGPVTASLVLLIAQGKQDFALDKLCDGLPVCNQVALFHFKHGQARAILNVRVQRPVTQSMAIVDRYTF